MKAISAEIFEAETQETVVEECDHCSPIVGIATQEETVDTTETVKTPCGAFVTACEPLHQGNVPQLHRELQKATDFDDVFDNAVNTTHMASLRYPKLMIAAIQKIAEMIPKMRVCLDQSDGWGQLLERPPNGSYRRS